MKRSISTPSCSLLPCWTVPPPPPPPPRPPPAPGTGFWAAAAAGVETGTASDWAAHVPTQAPAQHTIMMGIFFIVFSFTSIRQISGRCCKGRLERRSFQSRFGIMRRDESRRSAHECCFGPMAGKDPYECRRLSPPSQAEACATRAFESACPTKGSLLVDVVNKDSKVLVGQHVFEGRPVLHVVVRGNPLLPQFFASIGQRKTVPAPGRDSAPHRGV
jgi:hypothetical protein